MRRLRAAYVLVLILSFLFVDVSVSFPLRPTFSKPSFFKLPSWLPNIKDKNISSWIAKARDKLRSLFQGHRRLKIGETYDRLSKVQDLFEIYGYINSTLNLTDEFTFALESAIIQFQKNFNLAVTGQPDEATMNQISLPRCGFPDIVNNSITMNSGKENNTASFKKWWADGKKELTYAFAPENNVTDAVKDLFVDAFGRWTKVTSLNFNETPSFNESDIKISFVVLDGKRGVVGDAHTNNTARRAEVLLDSEEDWALPSENTAVEKDHLDLESVVMHQIGHVLGLGHSFIKEAIMYPSILPGLTRKVEFAKDDEERIQQLYGTNSGGNSQLSPTPSPSRAAVDDPGVAVVRPTWVLVPILWLEFACMVL